MLRALVLTLLLTTQAIAADNITVCYESKIWQYNPRTETYSPYVVNKVWQTCKIV
jgi:hypothetical protein